MGVFAEVRVLRPWSPRLKATTPPMPSTPTTAATAMIAVVLRVLRFAACLPATRDPFVNEQVWLRCPAERSRAFDDPSSWMRHLTAMSAQKYEEELPFIDFFLNCRLAGA